MELNKTFVLVQMSKFRWRLENLRGDILLDDQYFASIYRAECWIKAYVSSWNDYKYELRSKK